MHVSVVTKIPTWTAFKHTSTTDSEELANEISSTLGISNECVVVQQLGNNVGDYACSIITLVVGSFKSQVILTGDGYLLVNDIELSKGRAEIHFVSEDVFKSSFSLNPGKEHIPGMEL